RPPDSAGEECTATGPWKELSWAGASSPAARRAERPPKPAEPASNGELPAPDRHWQHERPGRIRPARPAPGAGRAADPTPLRSAEHRQRLPDRAVVHRR